MYRSAGKHSLRPPLKKEGLLAKLSGSEKQTKMADKNGGELDSAIIGSTGTINLSLQSQPNSVPDLSHHVHHLPCCIKFTGPTPVSNYFIPKSTGVEVDGLQLKEAFFRGRKLDGVSVPIPEGYSGFILGKESSREDKAKTTGSRCNASEIFDDGENNWETLGKCDNITFWNHDSLPSQDDASLRLFHLFAVAKALHEPLSAEDLNAA